MGKKKIKRETGWEREKDITRGTEFYREGEDRNGPVPLWSPYKSILQYRKEKIPSSMSILTN